MLYVKKRCQGARYPIRTDPCKPCSANPCPELTPLATAMYHLVQVKEMFAQPVASRSSIPARGNPRLVANRSRKPSGRSSALRDGRAARPAMAASLAATAAAQAALPPGAVTKVPASPVVPLADPQPAPGAAAEGVQPPVAAQADLHSEAGAQAADLTAPEPQPANRDEQGTAIAQVSCFSQTSDRDTGASCHQLC